MTILFITIEFNYCCGISRSITPLMLALKKHGHHIILASPGGTMVDELNKEGVETAYIPLSPGKKNPLDIIRCIYKINKMVRKLDVDIIHSHHRLADLFALVVSKFTGVHTVSTAHALIGGKRDLSFRSDKIIAVSEAIRQMLLNDFRVSNDRISLIRNIPRTLNIVEPAQLESFKAKHGIDQQRIIAAIGRLHHEKGFDILLEAISLLKRTNIIVLLVGKGEEKQKLEEMARRNALPVIFLDEVMDVSVIYSMAEMVIIPSRTESAGLVALEAAHFSRPVIASNCGGLVETIDHERTGLLFPVEDAVALKKNISRLLDDCPLGVQIGQQLHNRVKADYDAGAIVLRTASLYSELLNPPSTKTKAIKSYAN